ncbi:restriction endonuclease [uncultured Maribacter sp.]|uniref:nSTAND3 domain-containing NTPase n=1 Tax=uncultured Maribacter sp. TaxID=431308 RepID=UPI00262FE7EC|nr:restriction endonuclease [uncultured Maribacter sp.]
MNEYTFLNLSSFEFENLSRDILQEKLGFYFESFTSGQDGGVDLRASSCYDNNIIVQAKRYTRFSNLKSTLKKEIENVKKLAPNRYILTTSIGLTPLNKKYIKNLFFPYIKSTEDILGKDDLNNLLGIHPKIEEKYYKLWLSSTNILRRLVNSTVYNQSKFELDEIKEVLRIYVQNDSHKEALKILKDNNYVIISGIPGIGKTTLSRMLVYRLLAQEFDDFVYISESINDAYSYYQDGKKQVFFFDDFLGRNFLETGLAVNEDSKLIKFIERIKKSKNKILILATREYILKQARNTFELLDDSSLELAKCTLDLSKYTRKIKAMILYNHLFFANVPLAFLKNLIETKTYLTLIEHKSYNPRIIETFVKSHFWKNSDPKEFSKTLVSFFNNPTSVWEHAFENTISKGSQVVMLVLSTLGTPVLLEDLKITVNSFITANNTKYKLAIDSIEFRRIIKELENTFIITRMDSFNKIAIEFQNPSIQDFLINYIEGKNILILDLIRSFSFVSQFFRIFTFEKKKSVYKRRITLDKIILKAYIDKIIIDFDLFKTSIIYRLNYTNSDRFEWYKNPNFRLLFLNQILVELESVSNQILEDFVTKKFEETLKPELTNYSVRWAYISLLSKTKSTTIENNAKKLVKEFAEQIDSIDILKDFSRLNTIFANEFQEYVNTNDFSEKLYSIVEKEIENTVTSKYESLIEDLKEIEKEFEYLLNDEINDLSKKHSAYMDKKEAKMDMSDYADEAREHEEMLERENLYISDLFEGLTEE